MLLPHNAIVEAKALAAAASYFDDIGLFERLLAACPDVNINPEMYYPMDALAMAVERQNISMISILLGRGADPSGCPSIQIRLDGDCLHATHLGLAIQTKDLSVIEPILNACNDIGNDEYYLSDNDHYISPLALAVETGKPELVDLLVQAGADVQARHPSTSLTLLETAVMRDNIDMCRTLLAHSAPVNRPLSQRWKHSALSLAVASESSIDLASLLLRAGARVDDEYDWLPGTVIATAIEYTNVPLIDLLSKAGAEQVGSLPRHIRNLETAINLHRANRLQSILDIGGAGILAASIMWEDHALTQFLLDHSFDVNGTTDPSLSWGSGGRLYPYAQVFTTAPLSAAFQTGNIPLGVEIVARGAEITDLDLAAALQLSLSDTRLGSSWFHQLLDRSTGHTPTAIGIAIIDGRADMVQFILSKGVCADGIPELERNPNYCLRRDPEDTISFSNPQSVLELAILENNKTILRILCDSHSRGEESKGRALSLAILFRREELIEHVWRGTVDMNQEVKVLLSKPSTWLVHPGREGTKAYTSLHAAAFNQDVLLVQKILKTPATDINHCSDDFWDSIETALVLAANYGNMELVDILLDHGANVDKGCGAIKTLIPLQCAVERGLLHRHCSKASRAWCRH
ncbi:ankyrin repeat-containing domain protein [Aspergillus multicolor]|uniref:ankyrin repeat-containing domain protein n=1 Tax=Aspergillus multicolor TaxID=41759 RepID=UPI003CCC9A4A